MTPEIQLVVDKIYKLETPMADLIGILSSDELNQRLEIIATRKEIFLCMRNH